MNLFKRIWNFLRGQEDDTLCVCCSPSKPSSVVEERLTHDVCVSWGVTFEGKFYPFTSKDWAEMSQNYVEANPENYIGYPLNEVPLVEETNAR